VLIALLLCHFKVGSNKLQDRLTTGAGPVVQLADSLYDHFEEGRVSCGRFCCLGLCGWLGLDYGQGWSSFGLLLLLFSAGNVPCAGAGSRCLTGEVSMRVADSAVVVVWSTGVDVETGIGSAVDASILMSDIIEYY